MSGLAPHALLAKQSSEERARHAFLIDLKVHLQEELRSGLRRSYEESAAPAYAARTGRPPANRHEVGEAMGEEPFYQLWSALSRIQQEMYVDSTGEMVERQLPQLIATYKQIAAAPKLGTLRLDPGLPPPPDYAAAVDIHCVPGGYFTELCEDDIYVGARYEIGSFIFGKGQRGPMNDTRGRTGVSFLKRWPDFKPRRILDLGCTAGMNTLPYVDAYPDAEVHGIDLSAPALRYAHARAEALGRKVEFGQQNAERTSFGDASFDLVVSHILFHESSRQAVSAFMRECHRLLRPGGRMLHLDVGRRLTCKTPFDQFVADWDTMHNNEPFWGAFLFELDVRQAAIDAGFASEDIVEELAPTPSGKASYWAFSAVKR